MIPTPDPNEIAHTIQLVVAPVFLLAGMGGFLNVLAARLVRVVDRARAIEAKFEDLEGEAHDRAVAELRLLHRRMWAANWSVFLCTLSAVLVCFTVAFLFVAQLAGLGFGRATAALFILAMLVLIAGLILFLFEVRIAVRSTRIRVELLELEERKRWLKWR